MDDDDIGVNDIMISMFSMFFVVLKVMVMGMRSDSLIKFFMFMLLGLMLRGGRVNNGMGVLDWLGV